MEGKNRSKRSEQAESLQLERSSVNLVVLRGIAWVADFAPVVLAGGAFLLWLHGLQHVDLMQMNDLGLVSVLPDTTLLALGLIVCSFAFAVARPRLHSRILALHLVLMVIMLYGMTAVIEQAPRFAMTYVHAGLAEHIMRTGQLSPDSQTYFSWPGLFILISLIFQSVVPASSSLKVLLATVNWAPVVLNLLYLAPIYLILSAMTRKKRVVWVGLALFTVTNWIGQDYFSPQGFAYLLYLVILAIILTWFLPVSTATDGRSPTQLRKRRPPLTARIPLVRSIRAWVLPPDDVTPTDGVVPGSRRLRVGLLIVILGVYTLIVISHPLTPLFVIISVSILAFYRRSLPVWLPIVMTVMFALWFGFMARPFWVGHMYIITDGLGNLKSILAQNVAGRAESGSADHQFIVRIRMVLSISVWGLAAIGALLRLRRGHRDALYLLLALSPLALVAVQPYGGEMLLRAYLFGLPFMSFFAADLLCSTGNSARAWHTASGSWRISGVTSLVTLALLGCFLFARFGNEREDFVTHEEIAAVQYLYRVAPLGSILIEGWNGAPWEYEYIDEYQYYSMWGQLEDYQHVDTATVRAEYVEAALAFATRKGNGHAYIFFSHNQKAFATLQSGLPPGLLDEMEQRLLDSHQFILIYHNSQAQILEYTGGK